MKNWNEKRIIIVGAARQGLALARYLALNGARVTLTDSRNEEQLKPAISSLAGLPIQWSLGGHPMSLLENAEMVCLSGGIPLTIPFVEKARALQIPLSNDSQIFMEACPCQVIGITGSAGKTTTTSLVGSMAECFFKFKADGRKAWVGGNIGNPLINQVSEMKDDDLVILELSSFQLELMTTSPHLAAVLNISPNHLDRHGTMEAYRNAKAQILLHQKQEDIAVLNREDQGSWNLKSEVRSSLITFGIKAPPSNLDGSFVKNDHIYLQVEGSQLKMLPVDWIQLRGEHNLANVLAACAIAAGASISLPAIQTAIEEFTGVPHRLELVRNFKGADWYNDSIATAPERSIAALKSFSSPIVLLLGGKDKDLPWEPLINLVKEKVDHLIVFGDVSQKVLQTLGEREPGSKPFTVSRFPTLKPAVEAAAQVAEPGDVVLLSPGGTSFDEFKDFEERGEMFRKWVRDLI